MRDLKRKKEGKDGERRQQVRADKKIKHVEEEGCKIWQAKRMKGMKMKKKERDESEDE